MTYVDGFVIPVRKDQLAKYRRMARLGQRMWFDHGALDYKECVADDLSWLVPDAKGRLRKAPSLFPKLVKAKRGETVVFSYIVYRSKADRDRINKRVLADPRMAGIGPEDMPVDMKRMATAGFKAIVEGPAHRRARRSTGRRPAHRGASTGRARRAGSAPQRKAAELPWPA